MPRTFCGARIACACVKQVPLYPMYLLESVVREPAIQIQSIKGHSKVLGKIGKGILDLFVSCRVPGEKQGLVAKLGAYCTLQWCELEQA